MDRKASAKVDKRQDRQRAAMGFANQLTNKGLIVNPENTIILSLLYIGIVIILHMIAKFRKGAVPIPEAAPSA